MIYINTLILIKNSLFFSLSLALFLMMTIWEKKNLSWVTDDRNSDSYINIQKYGRLKVFSIIIRSSSNLYFFSLANISIVNNIKYQQKVLVYWVRLIICHFIIIINIFVVVYYYTYLKLSMCTLYFLFISIYIYISIHSTIIIIFWIF